jgi:hypothetical protein
VDIRNLLCGVDHASIADREASFSSTICWHSSGEMLIEMAVNGERAKAGDNQHGSNKVLLPDLDVTKTPVTTRRALDGKRLDRKAE